VTLFGFRYRSRSLQANQSTAFGIEELEARMLLSGPGQTSPLTPAQIRGAYGFDNLQPFVGGNQTLPADGQGQTIAILDAGSNPHIVADLATFDSRYHLTPLDGQNGDPWLQQVNETGGSGLPAAAPGWAVEIDMDVEWAHAIAPGANILLVATAFTTYPDGQGNLQATISSTDVQAAALTAVQHGASVVSMSFAGGPDPGILAYPGVTFVSTAGDTNQFYYPGGSSSALIVGGTVLSVNNTSYQGEQVWNNGDGASGGGTFPTAPLPSWQAGAAANVAVQDAAVYGGTPPTTRMAPDVAMAADKLAIVDATDGYTYAFGTSLGAPIWSGLLAIANEGRALELPGRGPLNLVDPTLPMLYSLPAADFHDIVGTVTYPDPNGATVQAWPGYDLSTGLGSPRADLLIPALIAPYAGYYSLMTDSLGYNGPLTVYGNTPAATPTGSDHITISTQGNEVQIQDNGQTDLFPISTISSIIVNTRATGDTVDVQSTPAGMPLTINLGSNDTVNLTPTSQNLGDLGGNVTINGQAGPVTLVVNDQGSSLGQTYTLTGATLTRVGATSVQITYQNVGKLVLNAGTGGNTITVDDPAASVTYVNNVAATDTVKVLANLNPVYIGNQVFPGQATQLVVTTQPPASVTPGDGFGLVVSAEDPLGNVDPTFRGTVTLVLANGPAGQSLDGTLTVAASQGVAVFSGLSLSQAADGYTVQAVSNGLTSAITAAIDVMPPITPTAGVLFTGAIATLTDTDPTAQPGDFTTTISWGDGSTSPGVVTADGKSLFTVTGPHTYAQEGPYTIAVTIIEPGGTPATAEGTAHVARAGLPPAKLGMVAGLLLHSVECCTDFVTAAYQRFLGRTPAAVELAGWAALLQKGLTDEQLEADLIGSSEYLQDHGGSGLAWVQGLYADLLGRIPTPEEVAGWVRALAAGMSPGQVAYDFAASPEREAQRVVADYQKYVDRAPSASEVSGWVIAFQQGLTNERVAAGIVGSAEYFQTHYANVNDWLSSAYQDILGRAPDDGELQSWLAVLKDS
jgi:hypothetical protein